MLVRPPRLARPSLGSALHLLRRVTPAIVGGLGRVALSVALLAAKAKLLVLLVALVVAAGALLAAVGLGVVGLEADVEEVLLVGLGDVCALAFWSLLAWSHDSGRMGSARTPLQQVDLLNGVPLLLGALLHLRNLDLLSELLQIALLACLGGCLLASSLVDQLRLDLAHVLVALHHLGEVVGRSREGDTLLLQPAACILDGGQALLVEGELAVQVVVDVGDLDGLGGGDRLVL